MISINVDPADNLNVDLYFKVLIYLAREDDGRLDEREEEFIRIQANVYSVDAEKYLNESIDKDDLKMMEVSLSRETSLSIVRDAIALGYINGQFDEKQRIFLVEHAPNLGLKESDIDAVESWLTDYWAVIERGSQLLQG